jgi:type II secretory pathway component PulK
MRAAARGVALISVLWVLAVLSVVGLGFAMTVRVDTELSANSLWEAQALDLANSGVEFTLEAIKAEREQGKVYCGLTDSWFSYTSDDLNLTFDEGGFSIRVVDEAGKLDINTANESQLLYFLQDENLTMSIIDWRDSDDEALAGGTETAIYEQHVPPYVPRNDRFRTIGELALVDGVTPTALWGQEDARFAERKLGETRGWADLLTVCSIDSNLTPTGDKKVNLNTAEDDEITQALELLLDESKIQAILDYREQFQSNNNGGNSGAPTAVPNMGNMPNVDVEGLVGIRQASSGEEDTSDLTSGLTDTGMLVGGPGSEGSGVSTTLDTTLAFPSTGSLIKVPGLDTADIKAIWDYVTAVDSDVIEGRVNINTAPAEIIAATMQPEIDTEIAQQLADEIVGYRNTGLPYMTVADLLDIGTDVQAVFETIADRLTVRSYILTIEATGYTNGGRVQRTLRQIVDVSGSEANVLEQSIY